MSEHLLQHWKSYRDEGTKEYLDAAKVNFALKQIVPMLTFCEEITRVGEEWTIHTTTTFKNHKVVFRIGEPFIDKTPDGKTMKTTYTIEGDKLVLSQEPVTSGEIPSMIVREITEEGEMLITAATIPSNVICKRWFKHYDLD